MNLPNATSSRMENNNEDDDNDDDMKSDERLNRPYA